MSWFNKIDLNLLVSQKMTLLFVIDQIPLSEAQRNELQGIVHLLDSLQDVCESQAVPAVLFDEREAFEKWATPNRFDVGHKGEDGSYLGRATSIAWEAWQARAAIEKSAAKEPAVPQGEPVHQFRKVHCADWYDGHPDHGDGGGPYEERTLYTAAPSQERCCTCGYLTSEREHLGCLRKAVKDLDAATGGPYPSQPVNRPQNCGTSYCSCIECVCEPEPVTLTDGYAGVIAWVGDKQCKRVLTEGAIKHEHTPGVAMRNAAHQCVQEAIIAALREKEGK